MFRCTGLSRRLLGLVLVVVPCQFCGCSDLCVLCADALCSPQGPSALDLPPGPTPAPSPVIWPLPSSDPNPSSGVAHTVCHRPQGRGYLRMPQGYTTTPRHHAMLYVPRAKATPRVKQTLCAMSGVVMSRCFPVPL